MKIKLLKHVLLALFGLLLFACNTDDLKNEEKIKHQDIQKVEGKTTVVNQSQLRELYADTSAFGKVIRRDFSGSDDYLIRSERTSLIAIDEEHIQIFDSEDVHAITYRVYVNDENTDKVYNLMYYSKDRNIYYVTLLQYDFSRMTMRDYMVRPTMDIVSIYPMDDYDNIEVAITNTIRSGNPSFFYQMIVLSDCVKDVVVGGSPCKGSGFPKHEYGDPSCGMTGGNRATPGYSYMDFSDCVGGGTSGGGSGGGGSSPGPGSPGGPGNGGSNPGVGLKPIRFVNPIKDKRDIIGSGVFISQINIGQNIPSRKVLHQIRTSLRADIVELNGKLSETREYAYAYRFTRNGHNLINNGRSDLFNPSNGYNRIDISKASFSNFLGIIHTHPIKYFDGMAASERKDTPMFSPEDLMGLFKYTNRSLQDPQRTPSEAFVGVVNKHGMYAVMLPDNITYENIATEYADFANFSQQGAFLRIKVDETKEKWKIISEELKDRYEKIEKSSDSDSVKKTKHEKALLEVLSEHNLKMNLYYLAPNNGQFNGNWQRIQLSNTNEVEYITIN